MASRKEQKEQARARREALEAQADRANTRTRRLRLLGIAVAAAVVVVVVAIVVSSSGGGKKASDTIATGSGATQVVRQVNQELAGTTQSGATLGTKSAPVSMTYYGDLQCPICKDFTLQVLPDVISTYVKTGKMSITYRAFETASLGNPDQTSFQTQQVAAYAAGRQNKAWNFLELFYHQQGAEDTAYVTESYLDGIAKQIKGLNLSQWQTDRKRSEYVTALNADNTAAGVAGVTGTPGLILKGPKGTEAVQTLSFDGVKAVYDAVA